MATTLMRSASRSRHDHEYVDLHAIDVLELDRSELVEASTRATRSGTCRLRTSRNVVAPPTQERRMNLEGGGDASTKQRHHLLTQHRATGGKHIRTGSCSRFPRHRGIRRTAGPARRHRFVRCGGYRSLRARTLRPGTTW